MINLSFKNPYLILVFSMIVVLISVVAIDKLPVDILPQFKTSAVQVLTLYPGMPAEVVEKDITSRIERWTGQSEGIVRQESKSIVGASIVRDHFHEDIDPNTAMSHVTSYAMSDQYYLPPGTLPPMVMPYDPTASIPLCLLAVSSDTKTGKELYDIAYFHLRNMLGSVPGIIAPAVYGGKLRRIYIYVDPDKLEARGLSATDVMEAVHRSSTMIPTGFANIGDLNYNVNAGGLIKDISDFDNIVVKYKDGAPIFVKDVGKTADAGAIQTNIVRINGREQVYLPIYKRPRANTIESVTRIKAAVSMLKERLPADVNLNVIFDQSAYAQNAIDGLWTAGLGGLALVVLVLLLFLGNFRSAGIVALSLPLSVLFGFIGLYFSGQSINSMTLGGFALALGLLVDNSIVVLENTDRHLRMGKPSAQAAMEAAKEVAMPVLASTLVIIIVFVPIIFLTGIAKYLFSSLAVAVSLSMIGSYLFSMTLIPIVAARLFRNYLPSSEGSDSRKSFFERFFENKLKPFYAWLLARVIRYYALALMGVAALFTIAVAAGWFGLGYELFPKMDVGQLEVQIRFEAGTRLEKSNEQIARIEEEVKKEVGDELNMTVSNIGVFYDWPAAYTPNSGTQDAFLLVQLKDGHKTSTFDYSRRLRHRLNEAFPGVEFSFNTGGIVTAALNYGLPAPIDVQIRGNDLQVANDIARKIRDGVLPVKGTRDVRILQRLDQPQIDIDIDRIKAAGMGIHAENAVKNIVSSLNSSTVFNKTFWIDERNGNHYFVGVTYPEHLIDDEDAVSYVMVNSETTERGVPVKNFSSLKHTTAPTEVNHLNLTRVTDLYVNVDGRDIGTVASEIQRVIDGMKDDIPEGYEVAIRGEIEQMQNSFANLGLGLALAVLLTYLIIVPLFRSFRQPLIILTVVPLGLTGVVAILLLTGTNLSIQSLMGVIMMTGISVAYGNILIDRINRLVQEGLPVKDAVQQGASDRLRPVLMTMLTTVFGLLPMALNWQTGGEANVPLARAIIGGVLAATVLTLFVIPVLYLLLVKQKPALERRDFQA
jgi:CzcA family heavy metal efflux pump